MSMVKRDCKTRNGCRTPLIAVSIHTGLVIAAVCLITYEWVYLKADHPQVTWIVFLVLDFPIALIALPVCLGVEILFSSYPAYVYLVVIPALVFSVCGGAQWYYIARAFTKKKVITHPTCSQCGYMLVGCTSDRCPECGAHIPPEMMNWVRSASLLSGCTDDKERPRDQSSG